MIQLTRFHNITISLMKKQQYISPKLTVVEFCVERGFAFSTPTPPDGMLELLFLEEDNREMETFIVRDGWVEDDNQNTFWN